MKTVTTVVHGIERLLDLLPEPLVLRVLAEPSGAPRRAVDTATGRVSD